MTGDICQGRCACYVLCVSSDPRKSCSMSISIRIDVLHFGQQHWCVLEFSIRCGSCSTSERLSPLGCPNLSEFKLVLLSTIAFRLTVLYS